MTLRARPAIAAITLLLGTGMAASVARAEVRTVGADGVQAAIERSVAGDVVEVPPGTYREHVVLDRAITLRGRGGTLDGEGRGTVLRVTAAYARVEGLAVRGSGVDIVESDSCIYVEPEAKGAVVEHNELTACEYGIWIHRTQDARVAYNHVRGRPDLRPADRGNGIQLFDSSHLSVVHNLVEGARDGVYVSVTNDSDISYNRTNHLRYGIHYMFSLRNTLRGNESSDNLGGIALMSSRELVVEDNRADRNRRFGLLFRDGQACVVRRNHASGNGQGMFFYGSTENQYIDNEATGNDIGIRLWGSSQGDRVVGNRFVGNRQQVFYIGTHDLSVGADGHGNYWSDYLGWDQDGDGVGETPYRVDSLTVVLVHHYPGAVLLLRSPILELLSHLEEQMPVLRVPTVIDPWPVVRRAA